jgi:hypothetical protein
MKYRLLTDVFSTTKRGYKYGSAGEIVKEVAVHEHVIIVEGKKERFSVTNDKLIIKN